MALPAPRLTSRTDDAITWWTDSALADAGVVVGFSERHGGVSLAPYASLNLAGHVGDDPAAVWGNRQRLLAAAGIDPFAANLTLAEQVHSSHLALVDESVAGAGARLDPRRPAIPESDALATAVAGIPLMLCFADCVPVVLVAPGPAVAVVHSGWRGALAGIAGASAVHLARLAGCPVSDLTAYIGAHIGPCHYPVADEIMSQFCNTFGTVARADSGGLDLDATVTASLVDAGVAPCNIARLGVCTAEATDRFFSYRSEGGHTGRHAAFACILPGGYSALR